mmetsp:Transcript_56209/g.162920  ORF Transcript_56209/g.162920 Transcript_56209/m.162920 type:complete len:251 (+) Transcript_56209:440-1192(+)
MAIRMIFVSLVPLKHSSEPTVHMHLRAFRSGYLSALHSVLKLRDEPVEDVPDNTEHRRGVIDARRGQDGRRVMKPNTLRLRCILSHWTQAEVVSGHRRRQKMCPIHPVLQCNVFDRGASRFGDVQELQLFQRLAILCQREHHGRLLGVQFAAELFPRQRSPSCSRGQQRHELIRGLPMHVMQAFQPPQDISQMRARHIFPVEDQERWHEAGNVAKGVDNGCVQTPLVNDEDIQECRVSANGRCGCLEDAL